MSKESEGTHWVYPTGNSYAFPHSKLDRLVVLSVWKNPRENIIHMPRSGKSDLFFLNPEGAKLTFKEMTGIDVDELPSLSNKNLERCTCKESKKFIRVVDSRDLSKGDPDYWRLCRECGGWR